MKCLNWKVLAALAAVGVGVYALAPNTAAAATPCSPSALCPLSTLLMVRAIRSGSTRSCEAPSESTDTSGELGGSKAEVAEVNLRQTGAENQLGRS